MVYKNLTAFTQMNLFKQIVAIIVVSFICSLGFNMFSPHGIGIFDNPWSKRNSGNSNYRVEQNSQLVEEEPIIFVEFDRACQFIENHDGIVLDARTPEDYAEEHIPGAHLLFFYNMNEYYPELEGQLKESPAILIYCGDFDCDDSEFLANELFNLGHAPILVYKGGLEDWKKHQLPVEKGEEVAEE